MALTGIQIFKLLPKTNCKECGVPTCLAFAMNLASGKAELDSCPYVSDEAKEQLAEASAPPIRPVKIGKGVRAFTIGGETVLANAPPGKNGWKIGIENPEHQVIGTLELANTALSTSGDSYQFFEHDGKRKSHIIDPATKKSKIDRLNVTTIAPSSILADAWATALRVLPTDKALEIANKQPDLKALFIPYRKVASRTKKFPKLTERLF